MRALDRLGDGFPHGLPAGFDQGCRGAGGCLNHGTELPVCKVAWARYRSDFSYKKRVDRGLSPVEILAEERAETQAQRAVVVEAKQAAAVKAEEVRAAAAERVRVREERAAARERSRHERDAAREERERIKLERAAESGGRARAREEAARARAERQEATTEAARREEVPASKLEPAFTLRQARAAVRAADLVVERAHKALRDAERAAAEAKERLDDLLTERASKPRRERQPHGTNASYARGCRKAEDCPNFGTDAPTCYQAMRAYHRNYMLGRRVAGIAREHHGTPYGYQLGCKEREDCPASPSCVDASLGEERRRRRERGIPEREPMVPAEPVRAHVRALMAAGIPYLRVAELAGVSASSTQTLLYGRSGSRKGPLPGLVSAANAERLMAVSA